MIMAGERLLQARPKVCAVATNLFDKTLSLHYTLYRQRCRASGGIAQDTRGVA